MLSRIEQGGVLWVDAYKPSPNEISELAREFLLPRPISEEISRPSFHPRAEIHGKYLYLILPLPVYDHNKEHHHSRELDIVVGEKFLLTIHYEPIESIQNIFGKIQTNLKLRSELFEKDSSKILFYMWGRAYDYLLSELDHIQKKIDRIEDRIFSVERKELIEEISLLRRDILDFSRSIGPHGMSARNRGCPYAEAKFPRSALCARPKISCLRCGRSFFGCDPIRLTSSRTPCPTCKTISCSNLSRIIRSEVLS